MIVLSQSDPNCITIFKICFEVCSIYPINNNSSISFHASPVEIKIDAAFAFLKGAKSLHVILMHEADLKKSYLIEELDFKVAFIFQNSIVV